MRALFAFSAAASVAVVLQGCGSAGTTTVAPGPAPSPPAPAPGPSPDSAVTTTPVPDDSVTTTPAPNSTAAPTTSQGPSPSPATPGDGNALAQWMNEMYMGYDPADDSSPLGVTIQLHEDFVFFCGVPCYNGNADCRVSTAIFNHRVLVSNETNTIVLPTVNAALSGIFFNQTAVETKLAKCSYQFDGATFNRLNGGCGCGAGPMDCDDPACAYNNQDPESGETATGTSPHVSRCSCEDSRHHNSTKTNEEQCYWKGPAFYMADGVSQDQTRQMLAQRVSNSQGVDDVGGGQTRVKNEYWDEIVLDGNVLQDELTRDAVSTIPAMIYAKGDADGRAKAQEMAQTMMEMYSLPAPVPLIAIDAEKDISTGGPFVFEDGQDTELLI